MKYRYREPHEMKDSGVEWLGMIPKEWEVKQLKYVFNKIQTGTTPSSSNEYFFKNGKINWFTPGDLKNDFLVESDRKITNLAISNKEVKEFSENSFVIVGIGATAGKVGFSKSKLTFNQQLTGFHSNNNDNKFYFYLMKSLGKEFLKLATFTTLPILNNEFFKKIKLSSLTFKNQQKIAYFLDKKCEEFDSVIAKKEMLINKLEEAKKSLISEVVTGKVKVIEKENGEYGIIKREAHEMKDSGVEWLGMIPKEWGTSKLKNKLVKFTDGAHISPEVENGVYPFLSVKDLKNGVLDFKNCLKTSIESYKYLKRNSCKPEKGDLLISKDGTIGKTCIIGYDKDFVVASSLVIIKSKKNFSIKYLDYILQSEVSQKQIFQYVKGAALPRISLELLKNIYIPFINQQDEQIKINNLLDKKCSQFDIAIEKQKESIEKLKSAKQSLISEAVTGKIEIL